MSYYKQQVEAIRFHETTAATLRDALYADIEVLFEEGLVSRPSDENPVKAAGKYVQKLLPGETVSAANVKDKVPASRELSHRAITAMLSQHPALADSGEKDQHGLKVFHRIELFQAAAE